MPGALFSLPTKKGLGASSTPISAAVLDDADISVLAEFRRISLFLPVHTEFCWLGFSIWKLCTSDRAWPVPPITSNLSDNAHGKCKADSPSHFLRPMPKPHQAPESSSKGLSLRVSKLGTGAAPDGWRGPWQTASK